jgi:hypothetical protein
MPDTCEKCVILLPDDWTIEYPYQVDVNDGEILAHYRCEAFHNWQCWWSSFYAVRAMTGDWP